MDILDIFYNKIIIEACCGKIDSFFRYNICFSTKILEDNLDYICNIDNNDLMIPTLIIKNKERFNTLLIQYVNEALKFYDDSNFCDEVINANSKDDYCKEKTILALLFSNATSDDFNNFEDYLQRRINFFNYSHECHFDLGYSSLLKGNLEFSIVKDIINNETPYKFILECRNEFNDCFYFPKINFGISDNKVYVYAIQNSIQNDNSFSKKTNRVLYKIIDGFDTDTDNYELYGDGNLKDITPSFLFVVNIFVSICKKFNYSDLIVIPYLVERWNAKRIAIQTKINRKNLDNSEELFNEQLRIQDNLTQKFIRTFLRLCYYYDDIDVINYPFEVDSNLVLKLYNSLDKDVMIRTNSLLSESNELIGNFSNRKK